MISFFHTEKNDQTREQKLANWVYHADLITNILGFPDVFQSVPFREGGESGGTPIRWLAPSVTQTLLFFKYG